MENIIDSINRYVKLSKYQKTLVNFDNIDNVYNSLEHIYDNQEMYDMNWAFHYGKNQIQKLYDGEVTMLLNHHLNVENYREAKEQLNLEKKLIVKKIKDILNTFKRTIYITNLVEIIVAFIVILSIHFLTDLSIHHYGQLISTSLIVVVFAFFKIFVERQIIEPILYKRQLFKFKKAINSSRQVLVYLFAFYFALDQIEYRVNDVERKHQLVVETTIKFRNLIRNY